MNSLAIVWAFNNTKINKTAAMLIPLHIKSLFFVFDFQHWIFEWKYFPMITVSSNSMCQLYTSVNPLQSLFWLAWGRTWLPRVLWEVNAHGLHSGIRGVMTEEVPEGERLFPAVSRSLFLTTRLPQQMASMHRDAAALWATPQPAMIPNKKASKYRVA